MAERGDDFGDDSSFVLPSGPETRQARADSMKPRGQKPPFVSTRRSGSHSPVPAWRRAIDLKTPSPPPPSPPPFSVTSMVTTWFSSFFSLHKVEPTCGVRPVDANCDKDHVPIVYNRQYDIRGIKNLGLPKQPIIFNKPTQVFSSIKGSYSNNHSYITRYSHACIYPYRKGAEEI